MGFVDAEQVRTTQYQPSPPGYGNDVIRYWRCIQSQPRAGDATPSTSAPLPEWTDLEFREGGLKLQTHFVRERSIALRNAKRARFRADHNGELFCERCNFDPARAGMSDTAIEVHHSKPVGAMKEQQITTLDDLQCLCANCHRIIHAELRSST
jgi:predicted HNH restriction endonuclease